MAPLRGELEIVEVLRREILVDRHPTAEEQVDDQRAGHLAVRVEAGAAVEAVGVLVRAEHRADRDPADREDEDGERDPAIRPPRAEAGGEEEHCREQHRGGDDAELGVVPDRSPHIPDLLHQAEHPDIQRLAERAVDADVQQRVDDREDAEEDEGPPGELLEPGGRAERRIARAAASPSPMATATSSAEIRTSRAIWNGWSCESQRYPALAATKTRASTTVARKPANTAWYVDCNGNVLIRRT